MTAKEATASLVYHQYALAGFDCELFHALRDLRRLRSNCPGAPVDAVIVRLRRLRDDVRREVASIDDAVGEQPAPGVAGTLAIA